MADVHDPETRSYNMSQIRGKNTGPELMVRKFLHSNGYRYRLHVNDLPGKPDLVLPKYNTVIQVHGCFWHAHEGCKYFTIPDSDTEKWKKKLFRNRERDKEQIEQLKKRGWKVMVVWECELKNDKIETLKSIIEKLEENR